MPDMMSGQRWRSSHVFILVTCGLAIFTDVFFYGLLPPILPSILRDRLHVQADKVQLWTSLLPAIYSIAIVVSSPLAGYYSDAIGRRKPLFMAALLSQFAGISLITAGNSLALWIAGLIVTGLSSGVVWTSSLAIAIDATAQENLSEKLGFVNISLSCGLFLGTVLGGVVYYSGGYYSVWAMCYALLVIDAILRLLLIEPRDSKSSPPTTDGPDNPIVTNPEDRSSQPDSERSTRASAGAMDITKIYGDDCGYNSGRHAAHVVGLTYMALVAPVFLGPLVGRWADRSGARVVLSTTLFLSIVPLVCLRFVDHDGTSQKALICILLFLVGLLSAGRLGIYSAEVDRAVTSYSRKRPDSVDREKGLAQAQGVWTAAYSTGCALGPIFGGLILGHAGWSTETWAVAVLSAAAGTIVVIMASGQPRSTD
ncbi:putative MFS-type transporter [Cercospora beticola]|uniref:Putative MFS-type transporter n=1 Tax=Cercospora beticola TaxID=122368 RepID=A0A2G5H806_CERBT|nr:putative MFS-type transporter [Cercospora beticola]PIA88665.1 putative MFS-type transporter [Cercospora beticola]WPB03020.1 hypothetical protein RHO25_007656 [Cercospora beticola]